MFLSILRSIKGYVRIRITGYSPERFINTCRYRNIELWGLLYKNGSYEMYVTIHGFKKLKPVIRKTGTKVAIIERFGLPFIFYKYRKRKVFLAGATGSILLIYILSLFIWNIEVNGNMSYSDETLIQYLEEKNISHGMLKKDVDCSKIVKEIRKKYDDIIWVSASVTGTRLFIEIKENETLEQEKQLNRMNEVDVETGCNIVSTENCVIKEIITRKGIPLVSEGEEVNKGDVLVTGLVEVLNDNKELTAYRVENAQADIRGELQYDYENEQLYSYEEKEYLTKKKSEIYFKIKNKLFWIGEKKNRFKLSESMQLEKQVCIGDHFNLPIWYGYKITKPYKTHEKEYTRKELQCILTEDFEKYCNELRKKGVEILENSVKIYTKRNFAIAKGTLTIICDIGDKKEIEIPELPMEED